MWGRARVRYFFQKIARIFWVTDGDCDADGITPPISSGARRAGRLCILSLRSFTRRASVVECAV